MYRRQRNLSYYMSAILFPILVGWGCARSVNPDIERGTTYQFQQGHPELRLSAIGYFGEEEIPKIEIVADIVYGSLFFKREGEKRVANLAIELRIFDLNRDEAVILSRRFSFDQEIEDPSLANSQNVATLKREIPVEPGQYRVELTVVDQNVNRRSTRVVDTEVPDPEREISSLSNIRMMGKQIGEEDGSWFPLTTYDVPARLDSLKFIYQMINKADSRITIHSRLVRFEADTSAAEPMNKGFVNAPQTWDKGIDYEDREIVQSNQRILMQQGNVSIEFNFPRLQRGNYRFEVDISRESGETNDIVKARDFSIKSAHYPTLKTAEELARPLIYLMDSGEYEELMSITDSDKLKLAVDKFWLRNAGNKSTARSLINLYYERVEEANKKFSNFKEGWKTDRGMIYILFGSPWYVNEYTRSVKWSYTYNLSDPYLNFEFRRVRIRSEYFPFDYYVLRRNPNYYNIQRRQVQLWLTGQILIRKL